MLSKKDRQQLIEDMKQVFPTKEDLDQKLTKLRKNINLDVGDLLVDGPIKTLEEHDKRLTKIEKHVGLPTPTT